ncbi:hypothetical protein ACJMK2_034277 [Sinanodonta woodiana]|uniref:procollagen-proline 4-dioxygenase n=1 Tax=Sinanodonta woodiana TaxID=1069815 RepID=A0ABD3WUG6_SINWO
MEMLAKSEVKIVAALENYVQSVKEEGQEAPHEVRRFLAEVQGKVRVSSQEHYAENPINAFHLVQRFHYMWGRMSSLIICSKCPETNASRDYYSTLEAIVNQSQVFTSKEDVKGVALGLLRLWVTYKLDIDKLIRGHILDTETDSLAVSDILYIAELLNETNQTYDTIVWLQALLNAFEAGKIEQADDIKEVNIVLRLAEAYSSYGMPWESINRLVEYQMKDPRDEGIDRNISYYKSKLSSIPKEHRSKTLQPPALYANQRRYHAVCRGEGERSQRILSSLKCFYRKTKIPIYRVKEEVLNYAPRLSLFYDVIFDSEAKFIKEASYSMLQRSGVIRTDDRNKVSDGRISETGWHSDSSHPFFESLGRRVEIITGLSTRQYPFESHSENFQVVNYGIGGMYDPHTDLFGVSLPDLDRKGVNPPYLQGSGDRVATFLFYLEDVKAGGATAFVNINVTVPVVKGAAAFWYNIRRNGDADENTKHAGCPVLLGSKWISNKWIRQHAQVFRRPCGKSPDAQDGPL